MNIFNKNCATIFQCKLSTLSAVDALPVF